jgi:hypothetical protein
MRSASFVGALSQSFGKRYSSPTNSRKYQLRRL